MLLAALPLPLLSLLLWLRGGSSDAGADGGGGHGCSSPSGLRTPADNGGW